MKVNFKQLISAFAAISLSLVACHTPNVPDDHEHEHEHEHEGHDPVRAEITVIPGHFHGLNFHEDILPLENKYFKYPQTMKLEVKDGKWVVSKDSKVKVFYVQGDAENSGPYALLINYYDEDGELLNEHFAEGDAANQHQHFFIAKNFKSTDTGASVDCKADKSFYDYVYMDTDPWNKTIKRDNAKLIGDTNPIGLKGYIHFYKAHVSFDLTIKLMHATKGKFVDGKASPFYAPTNSQLANNSWDVEMDVPFVTFIDRSTALNAESWEQYSKPILSDDYTKEMNDEDRVYVKRFMDAFGITEEEAFQEALNLIIGHRPHDIDSGFYF